MTFFATYGVERCAPSSCPTELTPWQPPARNEKTVKLLHGEQIKCDGSEAVHSSHSLLCPSEKEACM